MLYTQARALSICLLLFAFPSACRNHGGPAPLETANGGGGSGTEGEGGATAGSSSSGEAGAMPAEGDGSCSRPYQVTGSRELQGESTYGATKNVTASSKSCLGTGTDGGERVYKITVPATDRTRLSASVSPATRPSPGAFDPVLLLTRKCEEKPTCILARDLRGGGSEESLVYTNESGKAQTLFLIVDGYSYQPDGGNYHLKVELGSP